MLSFPSPRLLVAHSLLALVFLLIPQVCGRPPVDTVTCGVFKARPEEQQGTADFICAELLWTDSGGTAFRTSLVKVVSNLTGALLFRHTELIICSSL